MSPSPASGIATFETVWSGLVVTMIGRYITPLASAAVSRRLIPATTVGLRTSSERITTSAGVGAPGNAVITRL